MTAKRRKEVVIGLIVLVAFLVIGGILYFNVFTHKESTKIDDEVTTVVDGDFIYKDDTKKEIIGLSEDGKSSMDLIFPEDVKKVSNIHLSEDSTLQHVVFLNSKVELTDVSFANTRVKSINLLPETMTEIPENFLNGCTYLTTIGDNDDVITIPSTVKKIGSGAFSACNSISNVDLGEVETIGSYAFQGCINLTDITWSDKLVAIEDGALFGTGLTEVRLPDSVKTLGGVVFVHCESLTVLDLNNVETVGQNLCSNCFALTDVYANNDFSAVSTEDSEKTDVYSDLFEEIEITFHVNKDSRLAEYANNKSCYTVN